MSKLSYDSDTKYYNNVIYDNSFILILSAYIYICTCILFKIKIRCS